MELTAGRWVCRRRNAPFQNHTLHFHIRIRYRNRAEQCFRIWVERIAENLLFLSVLHQIAKIHNADGVRDMLDNREIVRNKQICQSEIPLQIHQEIDDLGLYRNIQCRHRFIADDKIRLQSYGTCNADALPLSAGKLMGISVFMLWLEAAGVHDFVDVVV